MCMLVLSPPCLPCFSVLGVPPQLLRFDQPVAQVPVASKAALDVLLAFDPPGWATNYSGSWLTSMALLVTVLSVPDSNRSDPVFRRRVDVGSLAVAVRPEGNLTSMDGTSTPSSASTVLAHGSWGDVVCDGALYVYSHTALVAAFTPPVSSAAAPSAYSLMVFPGTASAFNTSSALSVMAVGAAQGSPALLASPPWVSGTALRFLLPALQADVPVSVRVAASVPALPSFVSRDLPRAVAPVAWPLGGEGGCSCSSSVSGTGCGSTPGAGQSLSPTRPAIGAHVRHWFIFIAHAHAVAYFPLS
jgi:hypothetical protein